MTLELLVATRNVGKLGELRELLAGTPWTLRAPASDTPDHDETGFTFADNARAKALFYSRHERLPALADDSGLEIDALGGEPGVYSARYIDPDLAPDERNRLVLERLEGVPVAQRTARFVCHLTLASADTVIHETVGVCEGRITETTRGAAGFGYDPIFEPGDLDRTFAEMTAAEKAEHSHRGRAVRAMAAFLQDWRPA